jgi:hypothetical protein
MRNASITKTRNTNASAKAVITHSKVFATSATRSVVLAAASFFSSSLFAIVFYTLSWFHRLFLPRKIERAIMQSNHLKVNKLGKARTESPAAKRKKFSTNIACRVEVVVV